MLFDVSTLRDQSVADALGRAILARDPEARISVQLDNRRILVEGRLGEEELIEAMHGAGHIAQLAPPHTGEGSTCCGGCGG
ncbi:hypothetical protein [Luteimonas sp. e5]